MRALLCIFFGIILVSHLVHADALFEVTDPAYDDYEGIALVEALLRDKKSTEALSVFETLPPSERNSASGQLLRGDISFQQGHFEMAAEKYLKSLSMDSPSAPHDSKVSLRLAETYAQLKDFKRCVIFFERTREDFNSMQRATQAHCRFVQGDWSGAWDVLRRGEKSFFLLNEKLTLLFQMGLHHEAEVMAFSIMEQPDLTVLQLLQISGLMQKYGLKQASFRILEAGRLRFPRDLDIHLAWIQEAHQAGLSLFTAYAFAEVANLDGTFFFHAAESFRMLGKNILSTYYGQMIRDPAQKLKAQIARAIDQQAYSQIAALEGPLVRNSIYQDDDVKYALAYAFSLQGDKRKTLRILQSINKEGLRSKVQSLRESLGE